MFSPETCPDSFISSSSEDDIPDKSLKMVADRILQCQKIESDKEARAKSKKALRRKRKSRKKPKPKKVKKEGTKRKRQPKLTEDQLLLVLNGIRLSSTARNDAKRVAKYRISNPEKETTRLKAKILKALCQDINPVSWLFPPTEEKTARDNQLMQTVREKIKGKILDTRKKSKITDEKLYKILEERAMRVLRDEIEGRVCSEKDCEAKYRLKCNRMNGGLFLACGRKFKHTTIAIQDTCSECLQKNMDNPFQGYVSKLGEAMRFCNCCLAYCSALRLEPLDQE